jgi:predicted phage-related endonuclease
MWYLGLTGLKTGYLAVLIGGQKFRHKKVEFDKDLFDKMVEAAVDFWENFVKKDVAPIAIGNDNATLFELFPTSDIDNAITFEGDEEIEVNQLIDMRSAGIEQRKQVQDEIDEHDAKLKQKLGTAEKGRTGQYTFTWKTQVRKEYVCKESTSRVLRCVSNTKGK